MVATVDKADWQKNLDERADVSNELFLVDDALTDLLTLTPSLTRYEQPQVEKAVVYLTGKRKRLRDKLRRLEA